LLLVPKTRLAKIKLPIEILLVVETARVARVLPHATIIGLHPWLAGKLLPTKTLLAAKWLPVKTLLATIG